MIFNPKVGDIVKFEVGGLRYRFGNNVENGDLCVVVKTKDDIVVVKNLKNDEVIMYKSHSPTEKLILAWFCLPSCQELATYRIKSAK